jgi:hypothetical protein
MARRGASVAVRASFGALFMRIVTVVTFSEDSYRPKAASDDLSLLCPSDRRGLGDRKGSEKHGLIRRT